MIIVTVKDLPDSFLHVMIWAVSWRLEDPDEERGLQLNKYAIKHLMFFSRPHAGATEKACGPTVFDAVDQNAMLQNTTMKKMSHQKHQNHELNQDTPPIIQTLPPHHHKAPD